MLNSSFASSVAFVSIDRYASIKRGATMSTLLTDIQKAVTPTAADSRMAQESSLRLSQILDSRPKKEMRIHVGVKDEPEESISIPDSALRLLSNILTEMARGNAVALLPVQAELTTQQAADMLRVSRPFLIEQLEKGEIPYRMVGTHRRILFNDLMAYKQDMFEKRLKVLEELTALDQELGLGY